MKICILGAESTGKTQLAAQLMATLSERGERVTHVTEYLREWCDQAGRTPRADEQAGIAAEQAQRADAATTPWLVADTAPLMTAVYSELLFNDRSLYPMTLAHQRSYDLTLLTGLDIHWVADGLQRDGAHVREPVDALLRAALGQAGIGFQVVYGSGPLRLANALNAIDSIAGYTHSTLTTSANASKNTPWTWMCETCGDSACEHRIFSARLGLKSRA
jgi:nicotinamide riboside kinase